MILIKFGFILFLGTGAVSAASPDTISVTLSEALALARQHAPEPRRILSAYKAEAASQLRTLSPPPLNASLEYGFIPRGAAISGFGERTFALDQTLPNPVSMYYRIREGAALRDRIGDDAREAMRIYTSAVTRAYFAAVVQRDRVFFAQQQRDDAELLLRAAEARHKAGDAAIIDVHTARTLFAEADIDLEREGARNQQVMLGLTALLGVGEGERAVYVPTDSLPHPLILMSDDEVLYAVLGRSPGIQAARNSLKAAQASASLAISDVLPSFSIGVMEQRQAGSGAMYGVRVGMAVPLWFAFDQNRAIEATRAHITASEEALRSTELITRSWVRSSMTALHARLREVLRYEQEILPQAHALVQMSERAWAAGEAAFLDVVQTRRYYNDIAIDALETRSAYLATWTEIQSMLDKEEL